MHLNLFATFTESNLVFSLSRRMTKVFKAKDAKELLQGEGVKALHHLSEEENQITLHLQSIKFS